MLSLKKALLKKPDAKYAKMFTDFGQALKAEMKVVEKKPPSVRIKDLHLTGTHSEGFIYEAEMESAEEIISFTPCALTPENRIENYDVTVLDTEGRRVQLWTASEIADPEGVMILHIGEKIMIRELAKALIEKKDDDCAAGEKMFGKSFEAVAGPDKCKVYGLEKDGTGAEEKLKKAMQYDAAFIDTSKISAETEEEETAALLYSLYRQGRRILYLADKNSAVDTVMLKVQDLYRAHLNDDGAAKDQNNTKSAAVPFLRLGPSTCELPEDLMPETHGRRKNPSIYAGKDELEAELLEEDVDEIIRLLEKQKAARKEIEDKEKVIKEMEIVVRKTEGNVDRYHKENVLKKKVLIDSDYELDQDLRMQKTENKIRYAKETIEKCKKQIASVEESKKYFDKELKLIKLRKTAEDLECDALRTARIVGTALSSVYLDENLKNIQYDCVIISQASSIWVPALWQAGYQSSSEVMLIGDLTMKPEVTRAKASQTGKWLTSSIFAITGLAKDAQKGKAPENYVCL